MNSLVSRVLPIVFALASLLALTDRATAAVRAFSSSGSAQFVSPTDFVGTGNATHLGHYSETGSVSFTPTGNPAVLHVEGSNVYIAANGDELHAHLAGELNGATGAISVTVTYGGGTGRFANASGSASLTGQMGPGGTISVTVKGTIDF